MKEKSIGIVSYKGGSSSGASLVQKASISLPAEDVCVHWGAIYTLDWHAPYKKTHNGHGRNSGCGTLVHINIRDVAWRSQHLKSLKSDQK